MSDASYARMVRLMGIVDRCAKHGAMFTHEELDQILADAKALFSKEFHKLIKALVRQAKEAIK